MDADSGQSEDKSVRDAAWAKPVSKIQVSGLPSGVVTLNVNGRVITGPLQGFGQLWRKTYSVRLSGANVAPKDVIRVWKERFAEFWPQGNNFYGPLTSIAPGEVAVLHLSMIPGMRLSTGVVVVYADDECFTFMTPEGHVYAAMITFSAFQDDGVTVAQVQPLLRASDPLYELGMRVGIADRKEDDFWHRTLQALSGHFGVAGLVTQQVTLVDPQVQWTYARNIFKNAAIWSTLYTVASPVRWVRDRVKRVDGPRRGI